MAKIEGKFGAADPIMPTEQRVSMTTNTEPLRRSGLSTEAKTAMAVGVPCMQTLGQALSQRMYRYRILDMQPLPTDIPPDHHPLLHKQQKRENDQLELIGIPPDDLISHIRSRALQYKI
jgi:hypothetical protein